MLTRREAQQLLTGLVNSVKYDVGGDGMLSLDAAVQLINTFIEDNGIMWMRVEEDGKIYYREMTSKK